MIKFYCSISSFSSLTLLSLFSDFFIQVLPRHFHPNRPGDVLVCLTPDGRVCLLCWETESRKFVSFADYGSVASSRIPSILLNLLESREAETSVLAMSQRAPNFDFLYPTFIPASTPDCHPLLNPEPSSRDTRNPFDEWMRNTAGSRTFFDIRTPDLFTAPSQPALVAIACHLNCIMVGKLDTPPSNETLNERLLTLGLLHLRREKWARLKAHASFNSDSSCRRFIERLNKHLDRSSLGRDSQEFNVMHIFPQNSAVDRVLRAIAVVHSESPLESSSDLHTNVEIPDYNVMSPIVNIRWTLYPHSFHCLML